MTAHAVSDLPPFRPRPPWLTGDLQTLRNFLLRPRIDLRPWPGERLWLPVSGGDQLAASLHARDWLGEQPLVVLIHGLSGCEDSVYVRASARFWLSLGHPVLRLNLRGSQPSRPRCRGHYHGGRSEDPYAALDALLSRERAAARQGLVLVGYSLGGNVLIKLVAEAGRRLPVRAAASVSAPIDLEATSQRFHAPRNRVYLRWLLGLLKREATAPPAELSDAERQAIAQARTVREFDDRFIAPRFGFDGAAGYYRDCSGLRFLPDVETPLIALHADDDPWIPDAAYAEAARVGNRNVRVHLTHGGGHVGFHAIDDTQPWHDRAIHAFMGEVG
ncbi:YheT family hydrolase [Rhodovibrio salinarum]|uniref:AB hydrolase-1 domain-containing protein n=1 Tax=Rhodovibrio salinarum TaxID=1087 RepID=A0A934V0R4_9PROT|nr:alpha/beta fold hydrolase [Rhodovibrio salinarum]MBK1697765.1 hypothetical protein [Rhodovibrio salinarum]